MKKAKKLKRKLIYDEEGLTLLTQTLKQVRAKKKYTQEDLAYESGLRLSQVARIETVKINPTVGTIFRITRTLDVDVSDLFEFKLSKKLN